MKIISTSQLHFQFIFIDSLKWESERSTVILYKDHYSNATIFTVELEIRGLYWEYTEIRIIVEFDRTVSSNIKICISSVRKRLFFKYINN